MNKIITKTAWIFVYLLAVVFSIKNIREPDIWWQLRTGEWIIDHRTIPTTDPFSYTFQGAPWTNIKWGYECLIALFSRITAPECIPLLQALVSCLILFFIIRTTKLLVQQNNETATPATMLGILIFLVSSEYRFTGRPEMFSHLFTVLFIYLLFRELRVPSRLLYLLIPVELIWSNMHEGYGIGIVIIALFTAASWVVYLADKTSAKPTRLSLVALLTITAVICNPYGTELILKPIALFRQVGATKYTTEFLDYTHYLFWQKEAYIALSMTMITISGILYGIFTQRKTEKNKKPFRSYLLKAGNLHILLLLLAFTVLASSAFRNIIFLSLVATPFFIAAFSRVQMLFITKHRVKIHTGLLAITLILYILVVSQKYYRLTDPNNRFGLEVLSTNNPDATGNYLREHKLTQRVFCDYLTSSYLLWKLQPDFKTFIDLRDYEIFTPGFFQQYINATAFPDSFIRLDNQYHFNSYVCFRSQFQGFHKFIYNDSNYTLTHLDAVAAVYEKQKSKPPVTYTYASALPVSGLSDLINHLLNPFYKPFDYSSINEDQSAAMYYMMVGDEPAMLSHINKSLNKKVDLHVSYHLLGQLYLNNAFADTTGKREVLFDSAQYYFNTAIKLDRGYADAYMGLGVVCLQQQKTKAAIKNFDLCIKYQPDMLNAYLYLGECYKSLAEQNSSQSQKNLRLALENYLDANRINPDNPMIMANVGFLYFRTNDCDHAVPYLEMIQDFKGLSAEERRSAKDCLNRCR